MRNKTGFTAIIAVLLSLLLVFFALPEVGVSAVELTQKSLDLITDKDIYIYQDDETLTITYETEDDFIGDSNFSITYNINSCSDILAFKENVASGFKFDIIGSGEAHIVFNAISDNYYAEAYADITVEAGRVPTTTVTINAPSSIRYGDTFDITATTACTGGAFTFASSDPGIVSVSGSNGEATATGAGNVVINVIYSSENDYGKAAKTITVAPKEIIVSNVTVEDKESDGNRTANVTAYEMNGIIGGDDVSLTLTAEFNSASVGRNKPLVFNATLSGADAGKYTVAYDPDVLILKASILSRNNRPNNGSSGVGYAPNSVSANIPQNTTNEDGSTTNVETIKNEDGSETIVITINNTDGSTIVEETTINNDGSKTIVKTITDMDGPKTIVTTRETTTKNSDGSSCETTITTTQNADGSETVETTIKNNGVTENSKAVIKKNDDGSKTIETITKYSDGRESKQKTVENPDGSSKSRVKNYYPDGREENLTVVKKIEGSVITIKTNGNLFEDHGQSDRGKILSTETIYADGSKKFSSEIKYPDKSKYNCSKSTDANGIIDTRTTITNADKSQTLERIVEYPDGSYKRELKTSDKNGVIVSKENEKVSIAEDGIVTHETTIDNSDGSKSRNVIITKQDGSSTSTLTETATNGEVTVKVKKVNKTGKEISKNYEVEDGELTLTSVEGTTSTAIIPSTVKVDGKKVPVTTIGENAMEGIEKVQNVKISSSVITIENGAFKGISPNATISVSAKSKKKYKATVKLIKESGVSDTVKFKRVK